MTVINAPDVVTETGWWQDMSDETYFADPVPAGSLSKSGAKLLLPPSCPAKFAYVREHGAKPKRAWDFGHAAHRKVLGRGAEVAVADFGDWKTNAAKKIRDDAYAAGRVPILRKEEKAVDEMADAIRSHPLAGRLLSPDAGVNEASFFWIDEPTGVWRRARLDRFTWLGDQLVVVDLKTCESADNESCRKTLANLGYAMQDDTYTTAVRALELHDDPAFLFVFVEREPPYLVNVVGCADDVIAYGRRLNEKALRIFAECSATDTWPGYGSEITYLSLPGYVRSVED
jgi:hypothetical protein